MNIELSQKFSLAQRSVQFRPIVFLLVRVALYTHGGLPCLMCAFCVMSSVSVAIVVCFCVLVKFSNFFS